MANKDDDTTSLSGVLIDTVMGDAQLVGQKEDKAQTVSQVNISNDLDLKSDNQNKLNDQSTTNQITGQIKEITNKLLETKVEVKKDSDPADNKKKEKKTDDDDGAKKVIAKISVPIIKFVAALNESVQKAPLYHFKCRYDPMDKNCGNDLYTRTKDIKRLMVPIRKIPFYSEYKNYESKVTNFTAEKVRTRDKAYKEPNEFDADYAKFLAENFNKGAKISYHGEYDLVYNERFLVKVPRNPVGRTGIIGRGHLGKWGPNHAADPIVTRWKRNEKGEKIINEKTGKPMLEFVAIQRRDTKEWAIPGGMAEPNEFIHETLLREFAEEALNRNLNFTPKVVDNKVVSLISEENSLDKAFNNFFTTGTLIYKGYVDDPRNTDNAWMETAAYNFHDEDNIFVGKLDLHSGDDAEKVKWSVLSSELQLFASHSEFLYEVAMNHDAHW